MMCTRLSIETDPYECHAQQRRRTMPQPPPQLVLWTSKVLNLLVPALATNRVPIPGSCPWAFGPADSQASTRHTVTIIRSRVDSFRSAFSMAEWISSLQLSRHLPCNMVGDLLF
ncbi:hypothetical protein PISMIDRAFT_418294 [Pisolithus microcarpus 441]|uniref:Uncharacterized protein n=1 Tax=Pisolithus microcarpus 441 TaxID=765257 RepID=A0A0C9XL70_9AGAM|nr:hypothetical protein PISMIDRAFT_418294 [Pisolithus microcarpus 441]